MVPDTVLRLVAVQKALEDIIVPLLPDDADFAREQLELIIKSIALIRKQIPLEYAFHVHDAKAFATFADELADKLPPSCLARASLATAVERVRIIAPPQVPDRQALEDAVHALRAEIERVIDDDSADAATFAAIGPVVLAHTRRQTLLERAWVADTGFERDAESLPTPRNLIYGAVS